MLTQPFKIPSNMSREEVAETYAAYLLGPRVFINRKVAVLPQDLRPHGPYCEYPDDDSMWQLDDSNDFKLFFYEDGVAKLFYRNKSLAETCNAMIVLFKQRYPLHE